MNDSASPASSGHLAVRPTLRERLRGKPARIQLPVGPRQAGKTTLLPELAAEWAGQAWYAGADAPEASLPGGADRQSPEALG